MAFTPPPDGAFNPTPRALEDGHDFTLSKYPKLRPLCFMVFLEALGTAAFAPVITFFVMDDMKGSSFELGMVGSALNVTQIFGAALFGRLSDAYGRHPVVVISFFWASVGFICTAFVQDIPQLLVVRAFSGVAGGTWPICQAYLADLVAETDRGKYLGFLSATFAAGFVFGPGLATALLTFELADRHQIFAISGIICLVGAVIGGVFLEESLDKSKRRPMSCSDLKTWETSNTENGQVKIKSDWEAINLGMVCIWLLRMSVAFAQFIVYTVYSPLFEDFFGMGDKEMGLMLMFGGITAVFVQAFVFGKSVTRLGPYVTLGLGCFFLLVSLAMVPHVRNFHLHVAIMLIYVVGEGYVEPGTPLILAFYATPSHQGFANGVGSSFRAFAAVAAPLVGGELYDHIQAHVFTFASLFGGIGMALVAIARFFGKHVDWDHEIDENTKLVDEAVFKDGSYTSHGR